MSEAKKDDYEKEAETLTKHAKIKLTFFYIIALAALVVLGGMIFIFIKKGKSETTSPEKKIPEGEEGKEEGKEDGNKGEKDNNQKLVLNGNYYINIAAEDYGCGVDKAVISLDRVIDQINKNSLIVSETRQAVDISSLERDIKPQTFLRKIKDVYLSNENGSKVTEASKYITVEMEIGPNEGSPISYDPVSYYNSWSQPYYLTIELNENEKLTSAGKEINSIKISRIFTKRVSPTNKFKKTNSVYRGVRYNIATYAPEEKSKNLFVWLNGAGEGGSAVLGDKTDVDVTLLANKVTALAGEKFQNTLGGCHVLVPQAPTMWMDNGEGNIFAGNRKSLYLEGVVGIIDEYVKNNEIENVFIGGCSNGGYMTMNIAMDYGNKYQGYVPICEAMRDDLITDEDIETLKDVPIYFVYSKDDTTVIPEQFEIPTVERLKKAGAKDVHVSTSEHVIDTSGKYKTEDGKDYQYLGHFSWIYFFNDETKCEDGKTAFKWLAEHKK